LKPAKTKELLHGSLEYNPPKLSIGGLGGSGTRLFVDMCERLGFDFGELKLRLGGHDNLLFTHFFKRPDWFQRLPADDELIESATLFATLSSGRLDATSLLRMEPALRQVAQLHDQFERPTGTGSHVIDDLVATYRTGWSGPTWAWKEPNTHVFIDRLLPLFPEMKYIHVVRHGLDMAFSKNQQQFLNWSYALTGHAPDTSKPLPPQMLDFWLACENRISTLMADARFADNILRVDYDLICAEPAKGIAEIMQFLDVAPGARAQSDLLAMIRPTSRGRYKEQDLSIFSQAQLRAVQNIGFDVEL